MWHLRRKPAAPGVANTGQEADRADEIRDAVAEDAGEIRELAKEVHDAAAGIEHPPAAHHPVIDLRSVHLPPLHPPGMPPGEWHAGHAAEAPGGQLADLGLDVAMPLLAAVPTGLSEGVTRSLGRRYSAQLSRQRRFAWDLAALPTVIDPARPSHRAVAASS